MNEQEQKPKICKYCRFWQPSFLYPDVIGECSLEMETKMMGHTCKSWSLIDSESKGGKE
jgi:hypothetical protein